MTESTSRRTILQILLAALTVPAVSAAAPDAEISTAVKTVAASKPEHHDFGDTTIFLNGATGQLKSLTVGSVALKAGQAPHPPHQHPEEEILLITEGSGEISIEGKQTAVKSGDLMYSAGNRLHGIKASANAPMTFYYFKWLGK